jgi:hypothetical protein
MRVGRHGDVVVPRTSRERLHGDAKPRDNLHRPTTGLLPILREELRECCAVQGYLCTAPKQLHVDWLLGEQGDNAAMRNLQAIARIRPPS